MASVEILGGLERRLHSVLPQQQVRAEVETRLQRLGQTAKMPGFRPGKVPLSVLQQQYGTQMHQEVLGEHLQRAFEQEAKEQNLKVAGYPNFELKGNAQAEQLEYSATFEVYPEVVIGSLSNETVERVSHELTDADVEQTLLNLRKQHLIFDATDRAAQQEDRVRIDFTGTLDGRVFEGGEGKDVQVVLGDKQMLPDFEQALIGMKAGETKTFDLTFPADYRGTEVAGKQTHFSVTVHQVEAPRLPELDAEFAKTLGVADGNVDKLKQDVRASLAREVNNRVKSRNKEAAMDALLRAGRLDAPKALVTWEVQGLMQQATQDMEQRGITVPKGMTFSPEPFVERAQKRVKLGLLLAKLVEQHQMAAKPEQVQALIQEYAKNFEQPEQVVSWYASDKTRLQEAENLVLEDNVVAWVMANALIVDKTPGFDELMKNN
jgi:trigger factor